MQPVYTYQLNPANAKKVGQASRIQEKGAYTGVITRAEYVQSSRGTQGIELAFKTQDGQTADYLSIWTVNAQGEDLSGRNLVDALMTCMSLRNINAKEATIQKYDKNAGQEMPVKAVIFPDLMNKPVGLLLVREEYEKTNGGTDWKLVVVGVYEPTKQLTPKEILDRNGPGQLAKMIVALKDRPLNGKATAPAPARTGGYSSQANAYAQQSGGRVAAPAGRAASQQQAVQQAEEDNFDDIPF